MAQYFTDDFSGFSIGSTWTRRWDTPDTDWAVSSGVLSADTSSANFLFCGVSWDTVGDDDDVDLLFQWKSSNLGNRHHCGFIRGSGSAGSPTCYTVAVSGTTLRIYYFNASESGTSLGSAAVTLSNDTYYNIRFRVNGNDLVAKIWATDGDESSPLGTVTVTDDSSISSSGWLGPAYYQPNGYAASFDTFGVGTNGDTAPSSAPATATTSAVALGALTLSGLTPTSATGVSKALLPSGSLTLTGYAPTSGVAVSYSLIPRGALTLTGNELTSLVAASAHITSEIPRADLSLTGNAPDSAVYVARSYLPRGDITLTGLPPESTLGVATSYLPRGDLALTGNAPTSTSAVDTPTEVPTGALALTGYAPTSLLGVAAALIPTGTLSLTGNAPVTAVRVDRSLIPLATLVLTGLAPQTIGGTAILAPRRGGGVGRRWRRLLYRGRVYKTRTAAEQAQLLNALLREAEQALEVAQAQAEPVPRIAQRKADITRMLKQRRRAEAELQRELQQLLDDDEEVLLLIGRAWRH